MPSDLYRTALLDRGSVSPCRSALDRGNGHPCRTALDRDNGHPCRTSGAATVELMKRHSRNESWCLAAASGRLERDRPL